MDSYDSRNIQNIYLLLLDIKKLMTEIIKKQDKSDDYVVDGINLILKSLQNTKGDKND